MKQKITDAALVFGIATRLRTEQRILDSQVICEQIKAGQDRQNREQLESNANTRQEFLWAEQDRARHADELADRLERLREIEEREQIDKALKPVHTAAHYSASAPATCTEGTRTNILSDMQTWALSEYGPIVYWLAGLAGTGKTTITSSLCRQLVAAGISVVSFFISRHSPERNTLSSVITTLAHQLAQSSSVARSTISTVLQKQPPISARPILQQTEELLVGPLNAVRAASAPGGQRIIIAIDAMDECDDFAASDGRDLLRKLVPALCHRGHDVKLFLTSRYEPEIQVILNRVFNGAQDKRETFLLHEVRESYVSADIRTFVMKGFADIRERFPSIPSAWPSLYQVNELVEMSGKLFVFASTVLLWISEKTASPVSRLTEILTAIRDSRLVGQHERSPFGYLDALYLAVLRNATSDAHPEAVTNSRLRQVLFMVICGDNTVTLDVISGVLRLEDHELDPLLGSLSAVVRIPSKTSTVPLTSSGACFMNIPESMKVNAFHKSFPDFLVDPKRCSDERFRIQRDREESHLALAILQATQDLARVESGPGFTVYIQRYWCYHLLNTLRNPNLDSTRVLSGIRTWLQVGAMADSESVPVFPSRTVQTFVDIRFLLAVLVNKLPKPILTVFKRGLIALAGASRSNSIRGTRENILVHATMAIVLHARVFQAVDTYSATLVKQDQRFHRALREITGEGVSKAWPTGIKRLWKVARKCSSDVPAEMDENIALIKVLEICMVSRSYYRAEPVIPWLQNSAN
ncbi:hypothetical protein BKA62DRAFT_260648 [Auriculariales sp. MPI-PUGE-AT-0066]|nr:hypothetical protein BKA62DRAFT_260648 [Auriculariales sp. MPI-PUGE-AT-0066]